MRPSAASYRWPNLLGLCTGLAVQCGLGVFVAFLAAFALVAAEPKRCPLAARPARAEPNPQLMPADHLVLVL
jgi:hypothetical protein